jgi:hypothetical protein
MMMANGYLKASINYEKTLSFYISVFQKNDYSIVNLSLAVANFIQLSNRLVDPE